MPDTAAQTTAVQDRRPVLQRRVAAGLLCAVLGAAGGYAVADARGGPYEVVGDVRSGENQIGLRGPDGVAMNIPLDVTWTAPPQRFSTGRPACLPPTDEMIRDVRVTAVDVEVDGIGFPSVVVVHCD